VRKVQVEIERSKIGRRADLGLILAGRLPATEAAPAPPTFEQLPRLPFPTVGP